MLQMEELGAIPRTLADDIMLLAKDSRVLHVIQVAFETTMDHLHDLGGRLAPSKSRVFATSLPLFHHTARGLQLTSGAPYNSRFNWLQTSEIWAPRYDLLLLSQPHYLRSDLHKPLLLSIALLNCLLGAWSKARLPWRVHTQEVSTAVRLARWTNMPCGSTPRPC